MLVRGRGQECAARDWVDAIASAITPLFLSLYLSLGHPLLRLERATGQLSVSVHWSSERALCRPDRSDSQATGSRELGLAGEERELQPQFAPVSALFTVCRAFKHSSLTGYVAQTKTKRI